MSSESVVLECRSVAAGYIQPHGDRRVVVADVTFTLEAGALFVVLGRSGSGKSTLLRLLNRFDDPFEGTILYRGKSLTERDPLELRRRVALVLQTPVMFEGSVRDNLLEQPSASVPTDEDLRRSLTDVGLETEILDRPATDLSVGQQQRVSIARTLLGAPDVLLLDEPTAALDPETSTRLADLILSLRATRRLTTVVVTHDAGLVRRLEERGARLALLRDGHLDIDASAEDVSAFLSGTGDAAR